MDQFRQTRDKMLAHFKDHAAKLFEERGERRSVMLSISQYWNDSANDEVHGHIVASRRATPVWPHECEYDYDIETPHQVALLPGEECWMCGGGDIDISFYGGYGDAMVGAFELFCRESAHQGMDVPEAYIPFAIARRMDDGDIEVEQVGYPLRVPSTTIGSARGGEHWERWMFPLGDVIAPGCAHFERGFLARAVVYAERAADRDRVLGAPAWGTVHTIRFAPKSLDVLAPTMVALRDVGPLRDDGVHALARAERPWAIRTLRVDGGDEDGLFRARTLPQLEELELSSAFSEDLADRWAKVPWAAQLRRLRFFGLEYQSIADWRALRVRLGVPELSIAIAPYWMELAGSWELGFRADDSVVVRSAGFDGRATMLRLAELIGELPESTPIELISTRARDMTEADVTWLRDYTGRNVMLRA